MAIAGAAGVQVWIYCRQAEYMRKGLWISIRSARASKLASDAAKVSADGLKLGERAWMICCGPTMGYTPVESGKRNYTYVCGLKNFGKTPAMIIEVGFDIGIADSLDNLPRFPKYTRSWQLNKITVAPGDSLYLRQEWFAYLSLDAGQSQAVLRGNLYVYGYGFVRYLDFFSKNDEDFRETRFCHSIRASTTRPCVEAPPEYHKAT
jgi:hypothetical protein